MNIAEDPPRKTALDEGQSRPTGGPSRRPRDGERGALFPLLAAGTTLGAVLLAVSQFLALFHTHVQASRVPVATVSVGSAHGYALLPIALVAVLLAYGVWAVMSRPALLAVGALGVVSLLISLIRDLSYAQRSGTRLFAGHYVLAVNRPALGLYVETLGATILIVTCVCGFILLGSPSGRRPRA